MDDIKELQAALDAAVVWQYTGPGGIHTVTRIGGRGFHIRQTRVGDKGVLVGDLAEALDLAERRAQGGR